MEKYKQEQRKKLKDLKWLERQTITLPLTPETPSRGTRQQASKNVSLSRIHAMYSDEYIPGGPLIEDKIKYILENEVMKIIIIKCSLKEHDFSASVSAK